jgi:hypothetical protein
MMMAAGNTKPKIWMNLTAMILEVIRHVMKIEAVNKNQLEYRPFSEVLCPGANTLYQPYKK